MTNAVDGGLEALAGVENGEFSDFSS